MNEQTASLNPPAPPRWWQFLTNPSARAEVVIWFFLVFAVFGIRAYLTHLVPVIIWSDDAGSYVYSAVNWLTTGIWETDPRRGPIYSLLIAACAKLFGSIDSLMVVQHLMGGTAIILSMASLRVVFGRSVLVPFTLCSYAYAVYGLPIYLEHLIRNETILFFCSSVALASWLFAIKLQKPHLLWFSGIATGVLMCTKSVFGPFPLMVILAHLYFWRSTPRVALKFVVVFILALILPFAGVRILKKITVHKAPPQPQAGILLYARTAQFTWLEGGIEPEIKEQIRQEVEEYRALPKLNNNLIIYRTIVPHLRRILTPQGKLPADVNDLCMRLALEAISHNKWKYTLQVLGDLERLHLKGGYKLDSPSVRDVETVAKKLRNPVEIKNRNEVMRLEETAAELEKITHKNHFKIFHRIRRTAWMFLLAPVLFTSLLLPLIIYRTWKKGSDVHLADATSTSRHGSDPILGFWIGAASVWYFTLVLLSTVGRPLDRYLMPGVPIMFLAMTTGAIYAWAWGVRVLEKRYWPATTEPVEK